jgi:hypothetical protein
MLHFLQWSSSDQCCRLDKNWKMGGPQIWCYPVVNDRYWPMFRPKFYALLMKVVFFSLGRRRVSHGGDFLSVVRSAFSWVLVDVALGHNGFLDNGFESGLLVGIAFRLRFCCLFNWNSALMSQSSRSMFRIFFSFFPYLWPPRGVVLYFSAISLKHTLSCAVY